MKPFGVRLAAGAVTILLGALAAAQAQKDKSSDSGSSWNATSATKSNGEPPTPIAGTALAAGIDTEAWNAPPSTDPLRAFNVDQPAGLMANTEPQSNVQLVQHLDSTHSSNDSSEGMALPGADALGFAAEALRGGADRSSGADAVPENLSPSNAPSLSLPLAGLQPNTPSGGTESTVAADGPSMSFPLGGPPAGETADAAAPILDAVVADPSFQPQENFGLGPATAMPAPAMPEVQFAQPPAMGFLGDAQPNPNRVGDPAEAGLPSASTADVNGQPANILRGGGFDPGLNSDQPSPNYGTGDVTSYPPTPGFQPNVPNPSTQIGLAQDAIGLGQPSTIEAPSLAPSPPAINAGPGSFQNFQHPPPRMASLPTAAAVPPGFQTQEFAQPPAAMPLSADPSDTNASPGDRRLEGVQSPSIVIQKRAPNEVKVGKPAAFVIQVQNVGSAEALDVQVHDRIPAGMRLVDASPAPVQQGDRLLWQLGAMQAGDERTVTMQLVPEMEGELGSVARVTFEAAASVRTISTRPELKIVQTAPEKVLIGQQLEIELEVSNPGTGEATGVMLQEDVPEGLEHPKGRQLDNMIGALAPGEVRRQILRMRAVAPGVIQNQIRLVGDDGLTAEHTVAVEVVAPQLQVGLTGPSRRFLERQATYQLDIANVGTADASNIELSVNLDRGFTFVSTDYEGQYDPSRHAVYWSLAQLPAGGRGAVPLTLLPVEVGDQAIRLEARADLGIVAKNERLVSVDSLAELTFQIADASDPIEIGSETSYEIRVNNTGSRNDSNIRVQLQLPNGLELISSDAEAGTNGRGLIEFQPRTQLAAGGDLVYRVRVRGVAPGTHLVKAIVTSDQATVPVTKEESTMVYADQ